MTSSSNRRGAAKTKLPWTTTEEITLCTTWCNAMDTYVTRDIHSRKGFWEEVFANFEKDMGGTIRGYDAIVSKWKNPILPKVVAFSVVYDGVQRMDENMSSDLVLFQNALAEYQTRTVDKKPTQSNSPTTEKPPMPLISSFPTIEESNDEHEICHEYLTEKEYQQLLLDEEALRETLEEEARAEKARAIAEKEWEERMKE
ncbi:hypothetical protein Tco_0300816 [Tanacetum coccineum]